MVSQSPAMMIVGGRMTRIIRRLRDDKTLEQRKITRVGEECLRPKHQPDGGAAQVVVGHGLRLEHTA